MPINTSKDHFLAVDAQAILVNLNLPDSNARSLCLKCFVLFN